MSSWSDYLSISRAQKNKEALEKTNPEKPVLKDEDERFLQKITSSEAAADPLPDAPPTKIAGAGEEKEASKEESEQAGAGGDQAVVPETKPETSGVDEQGDKEREREQREEKKEEEEKEEDEEKEKGETKEEEVKDAPGDSTEKVEPVSHDESKAETTGDVEKPAEEEATADDPPDVAPDANTGKPKKAKKSTGFELPSQEEAEAATRSFNAQEDPDKMQDKSSWASYLPKFSGSDKKSTTDGGATAEKAQDTTNDAADSSTARSWTQYASQYVPSSLPSVPALPSLPTFGKGKDHHPEPVYNEDGTINEQATKEKEEREVSVLLDRLNLSSINNRVFSFSEESQKVYERFTVVLKDVINGAPTAYEDMDKLMKESGPQLEKMFAGMPPFVQTLVKSLPAKLGSSLGPELLAAMSEKPGNDTKQRVQAASKKAGGDPSIATADMAAKAPSSVNKDTAAKQKRKIPGLKSLVSEKGAVATMLRSVMNFLRIRFPMLVSGTNVLMSLAVFILLFVFWYCHKRGKETRLAKAAEGKKTVEEGEDGEVEGADDGEDFEGTDIDESTVLDDAKDGGTTGEDEGEGIPGEKSEEQAESIAKQSDSVEAVEHEKEIQQNINDFDAENADKGKQDVLEQPTPSEVPLPEKKEGIETPKQSEAKGAEMEAEKAVGV